MDILLDKKVKIRKPQRCWGCARTFEVGTMLHYIKSAEDGTINNSYWCPVCDKYWNTYMKDNEEGILLGELKREDSEGWKTIQKEVENK